MDLTSSLAALHLEYCSSANEPASLACLCSFCISTSWASHLCFRLLTWSKRRKAYWEKASRLWHFYTNQQNDATKRCKTSTWFCNFDTSWVRMSFVFLRLSITLLENIGVADRGGLGLLEYGEVDLELGWGGVVITGFKAFWSALNELGKAISFSCKRDGTWEALTIEGDSDLTPGFVDLTSRYLMGSIVGESRILEDFISPLFRKSLLSIERVIVALLWTLEE